MNFYTITTPSSLECNNVISITNDNLLISIDVPNANISSNINFSISSLIENMAQDHGCIAITYNSETNQFLAIETTQLSVNEKSSNQKTFIQPGQNQYVRKTGTPSHIINQRTGGDGYFFVLTPTSNCTVNDISLVFRDTTTSNTVGTFTYNGSTPETTKITSIQDFLVNWNPMSISGPTFLTAGSTGTYTLNCPEGATAYMTVDNGILNRTKASNNQSFTLNTTGLSAGEVSTIKVGYKFWSNSANLQVTLT